MASSQPASSRLEAANQAQSAQLRAAMLAALLGLWRSLGSWRETDIERFVRLATPILLGAQTRMTALTAAYLSRQVAAITGNPLRQAPAPTRLTGEVLRGVPLADEYARPFHDVWTALHDGKPLNDAVQAGADRLTSLATTDLQLAKTHSARAVLAGEEHVVGYRRVLEGAHSCGLCIVASTQRYHKADLMPIHPGCDCSVAPIIGTHDPGRTIDEQRLADAHQAIAERFAGHDSGARGTGAIPDYRRVLVVHEHGEIGPVLGVRGQKFTSPTDLH
jgi:hypothetical protein